MVYIKGSKMKLEDITEGYENYVLYVVMKGTAGYFWHDMVWTPMEEEEQDLVFQNGLWEPNMNRSLFYFDTKEECLTNMKRDVPDLMGKDCEQVAEEGLEYLIFHFPEEEVMQDPPYPHGEGDREHLDEMVPPRKEEKEKPGCNCHHIQCDMCNLYKW